MDDYGDNKKSKNYIFLGIFILLISLCILYFFITSFKDYKTRKGWKITNGTVSETPTIETKIVLVRRKVSGMYLSQNEERYQVDYKYHYNVNNATYKSVKTEMSEDESDLDDYQKGYQFKIYYDPKNPKNHITTRESSKKPYVYLAAFICALLMGIVLIAKPIIS